MAGARIGRNRTRAAPRPRDLEGAAVGARQKRALRIGAALIEVPERGIAPGPMVAHLSARPVTASMPALIPVTARLKQEPSALFGFVDPGFDQTRGRDVATLNDDIVHLA